MAKKSTTTVRVPPPNMPMGASIPARPGYPAMHPDGMPKSMPMHKISTPVKKR